METLDAIVGLVVIGAFFFIIGSKIYKHEKDHLKPFVDKVKGWLAKGKDSLDSPEIENSNDPWDHELEFRGQTK